MTSASADPFDRIRDLPLWPGAIEIEPLLGGITNRNYLVSHAEGRAVVRLGGDIPVHGIMRFNEHAASRAAAMAGISPTVLHAEPGLLVIAHIDGKTYKAEDVRADRTRCVDLVARAHREIPNYLRGPILSFNVFHILRDYRLSLLESGSRYGELLPRFMDLAHQLERAVGPVELVFGHNDLLAANFIDDGSRLWLIDWDYAGFTTPYFDLGGLSSNNGFAAEDDKAMMERYFRQPFDEAMEYRFRAMLAASLLRETMWSMVSEIHSTLNFDYAAYTALNRARFEAALTRFQELDR